MFRQKRLNITAAIQPASGKSTDDGENTMQGGNNVVLSAFKPCAFAFLWLGIVPFDICGTWKCRPDIFRCLSVLAVAVLLAGTGVVLADIDVNEPNITKRMLTLMLDAFEYFTAACVIVVFQLKTRRITELFTDLNASSKALSLFKNGRKELNLVVWLLISWLVVFAGIFAISAVFILTREEGDIGKNAFMEICFRYSTFTYAVVPAHVVFLTYVIATAFDELNKRISMVISGFQSQSKHSAISVDGDDQQQQQEKPKFDLAFINEQFTELVRLTEEVSGAFGLMLVIHYFQFGFYLVFYIFKIVTFGEPHQDLPEYVGHMIIIFIVAFLITGVSAVAGRIPRAARKHLVDLHRVRQGDLERKDDVKVRFLIAQMSSQPIEVTAAGFFSINRGVLASFYTTIVMFVVIISQMTQFSYIMGNTPNGTAITGKLLTSLPIDSNHLLDGRNH